MNIGYRILRRIKREINSKRIRNKTATIISNNCFSNFVYDDYRMIYSSPFVNTYIFQDDYINILQELEKCLNCELEFIEKSRHKTKFNYKYPIGLINNNELHFIHYKTEAEAKEKWDRRVKRVDLNNLYVKFSELEGTTYDQLDKFDKLNFENKVLFTAKEYPEFKSSIFFKSFSDKGYIEEDHLYYKKYFDVLKWLDKKC